MLSNSIHCSQVISFVWFQSFYIWDLYFWHRLQFILVSTPCALEKTILLLFGIMFYEHQLRLGSWQSMCLLDFFCLVPSIEERMVLKSTMIVKLHSLDYILSIFASCIVKHCYYIYTYSRFCSWNWKLNSSSIFLLDFQLLYLAFL